MPITWLDIIVLAFMLISGLLAMARGFTREVLSILSWAAAAAAALVLFPRFQDQAREVIDPHWLADIVLVVGIFITVLIIVSFITIRTADRILDSRVGALDRSLGFLFGLARGLVLVVIGYLFFVWLVPVENHPEWVTEAKTMPLLDRTGEIVLSVLPDDPEAILSQIKSRALGAKGPDETDGVVPNADPNDSELPNNGEDSGTGSGYSESQRESLNQLNEGASGVDQ